MTSTRVNGLDLDEALLVITDAGQAQDAPGVSAVGRVLARRLGVPEVGADRHGPWLRVELAEVSFRMRWCPPGRYLRGSPLYEEGRQDWEPEPHEIVLTRGFWLGETPVFQALWQALTGHFANEVVEPERPVGYVDWKECVHFAELLQARIGGQLTFRLPTDAEWEYACRAGTTGPRYGELSDIAWFVDNADRQSQPVGRKAPNAFGLRDMLGNVWEWCADGMEGPRRSPLPQTDPVGVGRFRIRRGGSWSKPPPFVRAACYFVNDPSARSGQLGFRLAADVRS